MERKAFLRLCGIGACGTLTGMLVLPGCSSITHVQAVPDQGKLRVPLTAFISERKGERTTSRSIIVEAPDMKTPIVVFRNGEREHIALLMRCTHRGTKLHVAGDHLNCPAHGSAFSGTGAVIEGPADEPLKRFPVTYDGTDMLIDLA